MNTATLARGARERYLRREFEAEQSWLILDHLVADGARTGPDGNVLKLFHSLTDSQRAIMRVVI